MDIPSFLMQDLSDLNSHRHQRSIELLEYLYFQSSEVDRIKFINSDFFKKFKNINIFIWNFNK